MLVPGLICSKVSLFLLFLQIFQIKGAMKLAIRIGLVATFAINLPSIPIESYFNAPSPGQSWEGLMLSGKPERAIYWGIVQSVLGTLLDVYMFVLPIPVISQLQMPQRRRLKLGMLFSTAFMYVHIMTPYEAWFLLMEIAGASLLMLFRWHIVSRNSRR